MLNAFIARIKQVNPSLNCVVDERFQDALADAAKVDEVIASNEFTADQLKETKPFLGVPISTKDCIAVKDMLHTSGLWLRRNIRSPVDADSIRLMREAGAIPFALTNVSECCMWSVPDFEFGDLVFIPHFIHSKFFIQVGKLKSSSWSK